MKNALLFEGRPSATGEKPYNPMASTGTNMAQSNPDLQKALNNPRLKARGLLTRCRLSRNSQGF
ncbi:MAG: potassium-transporting ATPase subunit C [Sutterella sp.]|uniref:potassium-transporting ATPase subunit C n=1 Tax=Duodenibacillus massiliensis TaxID=1852381 RepID=UPI003A522388|nr:potassium-transporting ATPase subunit C [Sutterella sp.]